MKNKIFTTIFFWAIFQVSAFAQMGINSTGAAPASSAMLDVSSTSKGFLPPRMTTAQRTAITSPASGLLVFDTSLNQLYIFSSGNWATVAAPSYPRLSSDAIDALSTPQTGDLAYDLTFKCLKYYNGTKWLCTNQDPCNTLPNSTAWAALGTGGIQQGNSITVDSQGNVYITGQFGGTTIFGSISLTATGSSNSNIFVAKYNSSGVVQWAVSAASSGGYDKGTGIKVDAVGNVYVTGMFSNTATFGSTPSISVTSAGSSDIFVAKYNNFGIVQWVQRAGGTGYDQASSLALDASGNILITGNFVNTASFGATTLTSAGGSDIFVAKCNNTAGTFSTANSAGGVGADGGTAIGINLGGIFLTGYFSGTATFGSTSLVSAGNTDIFLTKYSPVSNTWDQSFRMGGIGADVANAIVMEPGTANYYIAGGFEDIISFPTVIGSNFPPLIGANSITSSGRRDIFVAKFTAGAGLPNNKWVQRSGGATSNDIANGLALDASGNVYVTGTFSDMATFGSTTLIPEGMDDIFTMKYGTNINNNAGIFKWVQKNGSIAFDNSSSIACDANNNIYVTGYFNGKICFGSTILNGSATYTNPDLFVGRLKE